MVAGSPRAVAQIIPGVPAIVAAALLTAIAATVEDAYVTASPEGGVEIRVDEWPPRLVSARRATPPVALGYETGVEAAIERHREEERKLPCRFDDVCPYRAKDAAGMLVHLTKHGVRGQSRRMIRRRRELVAASLRSIGLYAEAEEWEPTIVEGTVPDPGPDGNGGIPPAPEDAPEPGGVDVSAPQEPPLADPIWNYRLVSGVLHQHRKVSERLSPSVGFGMFHRVDGTAESGVFLHSHPGGDAPHGWYDESPDDHFPLPAPEAPDAPEATSTAPEAAEAGDSSVGGGEQQIDVDPGAARRIRIVTAARGLHKIDRVELARREGVQPGMLEHWLREDLAARLAEAEAG